MSSTPRALKAVNQLRRAVRDSGTQVASLLFPLWVGLLVLGTAALHSELVSWGANGRVIRFVVSATVLALALAMWLSRRALLYVGVRAFVQTLMNLYFREISVNGRQHIPCTGPVIVVGSHRNQFIDGGMLLVATPRHIRLLMAASSLARPLIGWLGKAVGCIPVHRPQDEARDGTGFVSGETGGLVLHGTAGADFLAQGITQGCTIVTGKGAGERTFVVAAVRSADRLELVSALSAPGLEACPYRVIRKVDHGEMFSSVFDELASGQCIGLFPEGGSHDNTSLLPLKAGVALMALGAVEKYPDLTVTIVPCGFNYSRGGTRFRTKCLVDYGEPIIVDASMLPQFKASKKDAVNTLLQAIGAGLRSVTLNVPNHEFLEFVLTVKRLYQPPCVVLSSAQSFELTHRFAETLQLPAIQAHPEYSRLLASVQDYQKLCRRHGYNPFSDVTIRRSLYGIRILPLLAVVFVCSVLAAVPGLLLNAPVGMLARYLAQKQARLAKAKSSVKIDGSDVIGSYKLLTIVAALPCWYAFLTIVLALVTPWRWSTVALVAFSFPFWGYVGVRFTEQGVVWSKSVFPLLLRTLPWYRDEENVLAVLQDDLRARIALLVDQTDHPYKNNRIIARETVIQALPATVFAAGDDFNYDDMLSHVDARGLE